MAVVESIQTSSDGSDDVQIGVAFLGNSVIRVSAGDFRSAGIDYSLSEEQDYTVTAKAGKSWLVGYLATEVASGDTVVLVDHYEDPSTEMYKFDDGVFQKIWLLFAATLPPGVTDLSTGADLQVLKIAPVEEGQ